MSKKVFIGGPISHLIDNHRFDENFKTIHKESVDILKKRGYTIMSAHIIEAFGENKIEPDEVIVRRDLEWIEEADICIFLFPTKDEIPIRTDGTFIELGYAISRCKENMCFWNSSKAMEYSPMFRGLTYKNVKLYDIGKIKEVLSSFG